MAFLGSCCQRRGYAASHWEKQLVRSDATIFGVWFLFFKILIIDSILGFNVSDVATFDWRV
jgi:hypothetical protein